ncbi:MAG: hypothetical protein KDE27_21115 [Planctomycetes bacterium]|nr:hypothetical protein [Planctomycetota bacterium]
MKIPQTPWPRCLFLASLSLVAACARGGEEDRPQSEIKITASHHMFGFKSLAGFGSFPVDPGVAFSDRGVLNLFDDSSYTITRTAGTSAADTYALAKSGALSLLVTGTGRDPDVVFEGGYSQTGSNLATADLFFVDRVTSTQSSPSLGLYVGTRVLTGTTAPDFDGIDWHLGSIHLIFDGVVLSPENVARAAWGGISVTGSTGGNLGAISGTGQQTSSSVTFGGSIQALQQAGNFDGSCNLTLDYTVLGQAVDSRVMYAAAGPDIVLALDADEADGEAGMAVMLRKFDTSSNSTSAQLQSAAGTFYVGGYTAFVNPADPGADAFLGVMTLTAQGAFRLEGVSHLGVDFVYAGTFMLALDGGLTITIDGTSETWHGAIDREYKTVLLVDDFRETRSNGLIELNFGIGVRQKPE